MKMYKLICITSTISVVRIEAIEATLQEIYKVAKVFFKQRIGMLDFKWEVCFRYVRPNFLFFPNFSFLLSFCRA